MSSTKWSSGSQRKYLRARRGAAPRQPTLGARGARRAAPAAHALEHALLPVALHVVPVLHLPVADGPRHRLRAGVGQRLVPNRKVHVLQRRPAARARGHGVVDADAGGDDVAGLDVAGETHLQRSGSAARHGVRARRRVPQRRSGGAAPTASETRLGEAGAVVYDHRRPARGVHHLACAPRQRPRAAAPASPGAPAPAADVKHARRPKSDRSAANWALLEGRCTSRLGHSLTPLLAASWRAQGRR